MFYALGNLISTASMEQNLTMKVYRGVAIKKLEPKLALKELFADCRDGSTAQLLLF
jgi:hypothetical protein